MKLFLDFDLCNECNSFIADLTTEESLVADDIIRNDVIAKILSRLSDD